MSSHNLLSSPFDHLSPVEQVGPNSDISNFRFGAIGCKSRPRHGLYWVLRFSMGFLNFFRKMPG